MYFVIYIYLNVCVYNKYIRMLNLFRYIYYGALIPVYPTYVPSKFEWYMVFVRIKRCIGINNMNWWLLICRVLTLEQVN